MDTQKPSPARDVIYVLNDLDKADAGFSIEAHDNVPVSLPAKVVRVHEDGTMINVRVMGDSHRALPWVQNVPYDADGKPGTWHWPPRV